MLLISISTQTLIAQHISANTETSSIAWLGTKVKGEHNGHIQLKSGKLELKNGNITGGYFVIDMNSITCDDLKNKALNKKLVGHLESEDFFNTEKHPTATLTITNSTAFRNGIATITGDITIRGKTETITFETQKLEKKYVATIEIDRSKFNVKYGSKSFFKNLGDKTINDLFTLNITLVTN